MNLEKSDHIALTLSPSVSASLSGSEAEPQSNTSITRRSIRRSWNQLSRCQRNLICLGSFIIVFTLLLFLQDIEPPKKLFKQDIENVLGIVEGRHLALEKNNDNHLKSDYSSDIVNHVSPVKTFPAQAAEQQRIAESEAVVAQPEDNSILENAINGPSVEKAQHLKQTQLTVEKEIEDHLNKISIQELSMYQNNSIIDSAAAAGTPNLSDNLMDERALLEAAIKVPERMPIQSGVLTINEYIEKLEPKKIAQKQHFHGATNERQAAVVDAFRHSWAGYKKYAWGYDNLKPVSQVGQNWFGLGLTIVDALDTIYIMGLEDEFAEARDWVDQHLNFNVNREVNLFEVTIRVLGGLLSAYHLSGDTVFLKKSIELGNRLLPCFLSPSGIPYSDVNLSAMSAHSPKWSPDSSTSEVTTLQLEFRDLSRATDTRIYEHVTNIVNDKVHALEKKKGLVPIFINANTGTFRNYATVSIGARGDSYYEYLLKQWIQTGRKDDDYLILDYMRSIDGILTELMRRTPREQHVYIGELINGKDFKPKMDHLTCYLPGTLLLGHHFGMPDSHMLLAKDLLETCYQTYMKQPTQLAPEITYFALSDTEEHDIYVKPNDAHNLLRPEFIESLYYFYALTGNRTYQDMGWTIFQAFEKHTKVASGYTSIGNVKNIFNTRLRDMMESFWLGETLKYFYLLFSDNRKEIDLEKWVFNTEAHPLPIRSN